MITVDLDETIARPVDVVFTFITTPTNASQWQPAVIEQRQTSPGPLGVGSTGSNIRQVMGQRLETTWEVTAYTPNAVFSVKSTSGPVTYELTYTLQPAGGGTHLHLHFVGEPKGFFRVAEPLLATTIKKDFEEDHARLKALLESKA
jgi:uncharacterized protein YndB with AHSA1/START domain